MHRVAGDGDGAARVVVTGASGFIGTHATAQLLARGYDVHGIVRRVPPAADPRITWHACDLHGREAKTLVGQLSPTHLLHLAWFVVPGVVSASSDHERWIETSIRLARAFADAGGRRAVFAGTCAEYDPREDICVEDGGPRQPATEYGQAKATLSRRVLELATETGLSVAWARIFFAYGRGQHSARLIADVASAVLRGKRAPCSEGSQIRDFIHVSDVAGALVALLETDVDGVFNVGSGRATSVRRVLELIGDYSGRPELLDFGALPPRDEQPVLVADVGKISRAIGWAAAVPLELGIADTVAWCRASVGQTAPASHGVREHAVRVG